MPAPREFNRRILLVEDERPIVDLLTLHLTAEGYEVSAAVDGEAGLLAFENGTYGLVILDWMLPSMSGLEVLRAIRQHDSRVPVMMLTGRADEADRVAGLELGCDDYMVKPFSIKELAVRIKVIHRRIERAEELARISAGDRILDLGPLKIDHGRREVRVNGEPVPLTTREYDLLYTLACRPGHAFSREDLLAGVWGRENGENGHTVNSHVNRLRGKIEDNPSRPRLILTVWGLGYRFTDVHS
jgi:DNA-binding response OmpR family regulator